MLGSESSDGKKCSDENAQIENNAQDINAQLQKNAQIRMLSSKKMLR